MIITGAPSKIDEEALDSAPDDSKMEVASVSPISTGFEAIFTV